MNGILYCYMFLLERNHYHQEILKNNQTTSVLLFTLKFREILLIILCFFDRASRYNRVKKKQLDAQLILTIFRCVIPVVFSNTGLSKKMDGI